MEKVLLMRPPQIRWENERKRLAPPLGLLYIAGVLREKYEVFLLDIPLEGFDVEVATSKQGLYRYGLTEEEIKRKIVETDPEVVGIECNFTFFWGETLRLAQIVKDIDRRIVTIIGGHHTMGMSKELMQSSVIDYVVEGEGEAKILQLLDQIFHHSFASEGLTHLPAEPALDLLEARLYRPEMSSHINPQGKPFVYLSSRGCPINCKFCTSSNYFGSKLRLLSIDRVKKQIEEIKNLGFEEIVFEDDNTVLMPRDYRKEYFSIPQSQGMTAFDDGGLYFPQVEEKDVELLAESGVYGTFLPVESPSVEIMHRQNKYRELTENEQVDKLKEVTNWLNRAKIVFYCSIMVGFPGEGKKELKEANDYARFLKELGALAVFFHWVHPYPGTELFRDSYSFIPLSRRFDKCPEFWNFNKAVLPLRDISFEEAEAYIENSFVEINGPGITRSPGFDVKRG